MAIAVDDSSQHCFLAVNELRLERVPVESDKSLADNHLEYSGCGLRTASFEVEAGRWQPQASLLVQTDNGPRKIWLSSFAHCFGAENLTFPSRVDADLWALDAAKAIVDRASEKLEVNRNGQPAQDAGYFSRMLSLTRQSFLGLRRSKPMP